MKLPKEGTRMRAVYDIVASEGPLHGRTVKFFGKQVSIPTCSYSLKTLVKQGLVIRTQDSAMGGAYRWGTTYQYRIASVTNEERESK